jgi:UDP-N-acetylmuramate: L-alanyl-gamma-D-glutamyl-meso-diaminopimelate ligase
VLKNGREEMVVHTPLYGRHNISNLLSVVALAEALGIDRLLLLEALGTFQGVKRRQEIKGEVKGVLVLDDFAHHPTAVAETIKAVRERYAGQRLVAVFEPRSNSSRRKVFQTNYAASFDLADLVLIPEPPLTEKIPPPERFSSAEVVEALNRRGIQAVYSPTTDRLLEEILSRCRPGDIILFMSNGAFDNLPVRLVKSLEQRR